ncbi:MAG: hypothetical protein ABSC07_04465 [Terriglobales bacterium]|jgi:hypothetical protein
MIRRLHVPLVEPDDVKPHLAKPEEHWRAGYSAQELAYAWSGAKNDFPIAVRAVLKTAPEYAQAELIDGFFEREVELGSSGRNSQTDLMVIAALGDELGVIAVEGKVEESFAELVADWNNTPGKQSRLERLCETLGLDAAHVGSTRYQLLHRTASAIYEAKRYRCHHALMLVHSFSPSHTWFKDFAAFSRAMGLPLQEPNLCSSGKTCEGVNLRLAWVSDTPRALGELQTVPE